MKCYGLETASNAAVVEGRSFFANSLKTFMCNKCYDPSYLRRWVWGCFFRVLVHELPGRVLSRMPLDVAIGKMLLLSLVFQASLG